MSDHYVEKAILNTNVFEGCSTGTLALLRDCGKISYAAGEIVGEKERAMLGVVVSGKFNIESTDGGRVLMNTVTAGGVFGAATVFLGENYISSVRAAAKSVVLYVPRETLEKIMKSDPAVSVAYVRFLSERISFLNKKIVAFTSQRSDSALAGYIVETADESGVCRFNRAAAAKKLGIGRTTVYRALKMLEDDGIILIENGKIIITDAEKLASRRTNI